MSPVASPSAASRLPPSEENVTRLPSPDRAPWPLSEAPLDFAPEAPVARLARVVVSAPRLRTNTSEVVSESAGTRLAALDWKATLEQSADTDGPAEPPACFAPAAPVARLARAIVAAPRSRTSTSL